MANKMDLPKKKLLRKKLAREDPKSKGGEARGSVRGQHNKVGWGRVEKFWRAEKRRKILGRKTALEPSSVGKKNRGGIREKRAIRKYGPSAAINYQPTGPGLEAKKG